MTVVACCALLALLAGLRAALGPLLTPRLGGWAAVALGLAAGTQLPGLLWGAPALSPLAGVLCCAWWAWLNRALPGAALLLLGLLANGAAMLAHGGAMPLAPEIAAQLGLGLPGELIAGTKNVVAAPSPWQWLGDWIPIRSPWALIVASPGDLLVLAAIGRYLWAHPAHEAAGGPPLPPRHTACDRRPHAV